MFNVAILNKKELIKYLASIIFVIIAIIMFARYFSKIKDKQKTSAQLQPSIQAVTQKEYIECIDEIIPGIKQANQQTAEKEEKAKEQTAKEDVIEKLLQVELAKIEQSKEPKTAEISQEDKSNQAQEQPSTEAEQKETILEEANTEVSTQIVTPEPIEANPTDTYKDVEIRNQTGYILSEQMLTPDIEIDKSNIIIFHTHTCESYTPTEQNQYEASGTYRTVDLNYSVARVGDELEKYLINYGYNVVHDKTYHDYPAYTGSYTRSLQTIQNIQQSTPADIIIDLHRDAIGSNSEYAPTVKIGDDYCAQLMFVIGSNGGGLWHPDWNQNLKFAIKVQQKAQELYPGLFKPIILRNSRYNQHVSKCASIVEVGATGNTLEQCEESMKYFSKILDLL